MATNEGDDGPREGIWDLLDELEEDELMSYAQVLEGEGLNAPPMPIDLAWTYLFLYRKTEAFESEGIEAVHKPKDPSPQDRTQFHQSFLQQLSHCLFTFGLQDILEIVIVVFMHRQLVSPSENFRYLQELQEWFHSERPWPAHIVE
ncbi:hypothetical protein BcDW1_6052 [Botrytis cinerea BcDW1]|uniref:Uncharacterized protein n=1 Tax=Botryotinia fuckeliana (strain BcDW1) TaxID=1290391 RepID=M7TVJ8_BOTF1|nr:hypothetical protein BcDW1_6052 [Botrytis cinerea BcDW1]